MTDAEINDLARVLDQKAKSQRHMTETLGETDDGDWKYERGIWRYRKPGASYYYDPRLIGVDRAYVATSRANQLFAVTLGIITVAFVILMLGMPFMAR